MDSGYNISSDKPSPRRIKAIEFGWSNCESGSTISESMESIRNARVGWAKRILKESWAHCSLNQIIEAQKIIRKNG